MQQHLDEIEVTIFDTETTGLDPSSGDRVIEIAAIRVKGREKIGEFQSLVNPDREVSLAAFRVNGISDEMLSDAPSMREIAPQFLAFARGSCLCSYNAPFDMKFLENELKIIGTNLAVDLPVFDVLKMARRLLPGFERYALWFVADALGIRTRQEHRALSDVMMTYDVLNKLTDKLKDKGLSDFRHVRHLFGIDAVFLNNLIEEKIAQISEAVDLGSRLKIQYLSSETKLTEREVIPKEIRAERGSRYLVGHCCLRNEERSFRIDHILHLEIL